MNEIEMIKYFNAYWNIPILAENPELVKRIKGKYVAYGCNNQYLNSGRKGSIISNLDLILNIKNLNKNNIPCFITLTNYYVEPHHLQDKGLNNILSFMNKNPINGVLCSNEMLYLYIRNNFSRLKLKCSIIKSTMEDEIHNIDWYIKMLDKFDYVVLNPELDFKKIFTIPQEFRKRIEILVNEGCVNPCPRRKYHYIYLMKEKENISYKCKLPDGIKTCELSLDQIQRLLDAGFEQFKIQGKYRGSEIIKSIVKLMPLGEI